MSALFTCVLFCVLVSVGSASGGEMAVHIAFLDDPPYQKCWWPWTEDRFRLEVTIQNDTDSVWAVDKLTPCYDCNPKFLVRSVKDGVEPPRTYQLDILHIVRDARYLDLAPGKRYVDTVDIAKYLRWDFEDGAEYILWIEYRPTDRYQFEDTTRTAPIWRERLISDTLIWTFE